RKVLASTFPVIKRLVGAAFFDAACEHFVRGHPSTRGDVNHYGCEFAAFLESYAPARALAYLADVARLEWAIDQANIAADAPLSATPRPAPAKTIPRSTFRPSCESTSSIGRSSRFESPRFRNQKASDERHRVEFARSARRACLLRRKQSSRPAATDSPARIQA